MAKKIYLATPVNGRKERTLYLKQRAALERVIEMERYLRRWYPDAEFWSSVGNMPIARHGDESKEAKIMGHCVTMVMESDMVILDDGWESSQGCTVERFVAMQYGKQVETLNHIKLKENLDNYESK